MSEKELNDIKNVENEKEERDYIKYSEIEAKEVEWLWYPYFPKSMVSIIQGDPKCGKTYMLIDIIARITRGDYMPLSDIKFEEGNVIFQNNDDPQEYTLVKRLEQQGANLDKVIFVNEKNKKLTFANLERLENTIKEFNPLLIIIDPIQAFMGNADSNAIGQVRNSLAPLKTLAEKYNCAIILVQHLKKGVESKAIYKGVGSIDFVGFARSMAMVVKNSEDNNERLFVHTTSNITKEGTCLSYKITDKGLEWLENKGEVDVDETANQDISTKFANAKYFILGCLASRNEISAKELQDISIVGGFSERTFNGARSFLSKNEVIKSFRKDNQVYWYLKANPYKLQSCKVENATNQDN